MSGVHITTPFAAAGTYHFEATIDGAKVECDSKVVTLAAMSEPPPPPLPCDPAFTVSVHYGPLSSSGSLDDVHVFVAFATQTAKSITLHVSRDQVDLGTKAFVPRYEDAPGPNGPHCEPKVCTFATESFP